MKLAAGTTLITNGKLIDGTGKAPLPNASLVIQDGHIAYAGPTLQSRQRCFWKVRSWDGDNQPSNWSAPAWWEMGLLGKGDWHGQWIGRTTDNSYQPAPMLRHAFRAASCTASSASSRRCSMLYARR